jgi:hypothetical protein
MPSWIRAPPESLMKTNGEPVFMLSCIISTILSQWIFARGAARDGEVLARDVDESPLDGAVPGDDAVRGEFLVLHAELGAAMTGEAVALLEGLGIEQDIDALAGGELAGFVLLVDALLPAAEVEDALAFLEFGDAVGHGGRGAFGRGISHGDRREVRRPP